MFIMPLSFAFVVYTFQHISWRRISCQTHWLHPIRDTRTIFHHFIWRVGMRKLASNGMGAGGMSGKREEEVERENEERERERTIEQNEEGISLWLCDLVHKFNIKSRNMHSTQSIKSYQFELVSKRFQLIPIYSHLHNFREFVSICRNDISDDTNQKKS